MTPVFVCKRPSCNRLCSYRKLRQIHFFLFSFFFYFACLFCACTASVLKLLVFYMEDLKFVGTCYKLFFNSLHLSDVPEWMLFILCCYAPGTLLPRFKQKHNSFHLVLSILPQQQANCVLVHWELILQQLWVSWYPSKDKWWSLKKK